MPYMHEKLEGGPTNEIIIIRRMEAGADYVI
jgi:hypothetical protein